MLPLRLSSQGFLVVRRVLELTQSNYCLGPGAHVGLAEVFSIADPGAGCRHRRRISLSLIPLRFKGLIQCDDLKSSLGESFIQCFVDLRVGAAELESTESDLFRRRFGGNGSCVSCRKPVLQKVHPLHGMSDVFDHRADGIQMLWFNRGDAL